MTTIRELIAADIEQTIQEISQLAGYETDPEGEQQPPQGSRPRNWLVEAQDNGDSPIEDSPLQKNDYFANYVLRCFVVLSEDADAPSPAVTIFRLVADVKRKFMEDFTRGGNAIDTIFRADGPLPGDSPDGYTGRAISMDIYYRTTRDNPYEL